MERLILDPNRPDSQIISRAVEVITNGGVIICPTDTVYILATNALDETAIKKIFEIKDRNEHKPIHVNVRDFKMAASLVEFNSPGRILFNKFTPGPITIVLPKKPIVPGYLTGGLSTLGIR